MIRLVTGLSVLSLVGCIQVNAPEATASVDGGDFVVSDDGVVTLGDSVPRAGGASPCAADEALVSNGTTWACQPVGEGGGGGGVANVDADAPLLAEVDQDEVTLSLDEARVPVLASGCNANEVPTAVGDGTWVCQQDYLRQLEALCAEGEVAKMSPAGEWACAEDTDALAALIDGCADGEVVAVAGGAFTCAPDADGLDALLTACNEGDIVALSGGSFACNAVVDVGNAFAVNIDGEAVYGGDVALGGDDADPLAFDTGRRVTIGAVAGEPTFFTMLAGDGVDSVFTFANETANAGEYDVKGSIGTAGGDLVIYRNDVNDIPVERMRFQEDRDVGIGVSDPQHRLHVSGVTHIDANTLRLQTTSGGASGIARVRYYNDQGTATAWAGFPDEFTDTFEVTNLVSGGDIDVNAGGAQVHLDGTNGRVGVGTDTPELPLHVAGVGLFEGRLSLRATGTPTSPNQTGNVVFQWQKVDGSQSGFFGYQSGSNDIFALNASDAEEMQVVAGLSGRLYLEGDGDFGVGVADPEHALHVNGNICPSASGDTNCDGMIVNTSDRRLKTDIEPLDDVVDKLLTLSGIRFTFKSDAAKRRHVGLIAQEVQRHYPELIAEGPDGYLHMDYSKLGAILVEAVKEQQADIDALRAENDALKARLDRIEALLEKRQR